LVAIDLRIGRELWRAELGPGALGPMWLRERWLIVRQGPTLRFYDRVTGAGATVDIGGHPCVTDDAVYVSRTDGLRAIALDDLAERALATDWGAGGPPLLFGPCGRRGDSLVLLVGARGGRGSRADPDALAGRAGIAAEVVGVDAQTGALRWRAPLGPADLPSVVEGAAQRLYPDMLPLAGPLPPRVPIHLISQARGGAGTRVAMVDVDAGQVAWQLRRGRTAVDITLVREGARSYYYEPQTRILATLSGDTGAIEHAIRLVGAGPVWPMQVIGDRVWLYGGAGWAVLDARTFEIVGNRGPPLSFEDASGDLRPL
jgi:hypothetical protein